MHQTKTNTGWVAFVPAPVQRPVPAEQERYHGDARDVVLQGFHWDSHAGCAGPAAERKGWYRILAENAGVIRAAGFSWVWFPPASDSLAPQGYIPRRWHLFDSAYGTEAELRAAVRALGPVKAMADVVLNHRVGLHTGGADFADPPFPDNLAAIAGDDESGVGTGSPDTGERHPAGRDLDHTNPGVRAAVKEYLGRLRDVGFQGWRYDLVKGYHGRFVGEYNEASDPLLSVGEVFERDRGVVNDWVESTGGRSTAFDFPTRYLLYEACRYEDFGRLRAWHNGRTGPAGLIGLCPGRAVTFLDNHDTEYRRDEEHAYVCNGTRHFPGRMVEMGYAYLLTHPGIPCVFWPHYFDWGHGTQAQIDRLLRLRRRAGLHARSRVDICEARYGLYAAVVDGRVAVKLGHQDWSPGWGWRLVADGERFAVWGRM